MSHHHHGHHHHGHHHHNHHHHDHQSLECGYGAAPMMPGAGFGYNQCQMMASSYAVQAPPCNINGYGYGAVSPYQSSGSAAMYQEVQRMQQLHYLQAEEHRHKQHEHRGAVVAVGAAAFVLYEKHEEKVDPAHAHRHHVGAQIAEAAASGLGGCALYEHHQAHNLHKAEAALQHHGHHGHHHHCHRHHCHRHHHGHH